MFNECLTCYITSSPTPRGLSLFTSLKNMTGIKLIYSSCERAYAWIVLRHEGISVIVHWKRYRWIREFWVRMESMRLWQIGNVDKFFKKVRLKKIGAVRSWCFPGLHKNSQNQKTKLSDETRPATLQSETCRDTYANFVAPRHIKREKVLLPVNVRPSKTSVCLNSLISFKCCRLLSYT